MTPPSDILLQNLSVDHARPVQSLANGGLLGADTIDPCMNLLDTVALFGAAALAAPIGLLGVEFLVDGRTLLGAGFLAVAVALVLGIVYRPDPVDVVGGRALGWLQSGAEDGDAEGE